MYDNETESPRTVELERDVVRLKKEIKVLVKNQKLFQKTIEEQNTKIRRLERRTSSSTVYGNSQYNQ